MASPPRQGSWRRCYRQSRGSLDVTTATLGQNLEGVWSDRPCSVRGARRLHCRAARRSVMQWRARRHAARNQAWRRSAPGPEWPACDRLERCCGRAVCRCSVLGRRSWKRGPTIRRSAPARRRKFAPRRSRRLRAIAFGLRHLDRWHRRRWLRPVLPRARRCGVLRAPAFLRVAIASGAMAAGVLGLHECDNPMCVKIAATTDRQAHVVSGSQGDDIERMARMRRGGGRHAVRRFDSRGVRRTRSVRCAPRCGTAEMPPLCRRRCLATNPRWVKAASR